MANKPKRVTYTATPDIELLMDKAKRIFYDYNQSEMIRILITAGLDTLKMKRGLSAPYPTRLDSGSPDKSFYVYIKLSI